MEPNAQADLVVRVPNDIQFHVHICTIVIVLKMKHKISWKMGRIFIAQNKSGTIQSVMIRKNNTIQDL